MRSRQVRREPDLPREPGSHISAEGSYREHIARLTKKYPNLEHKDRNRYEYDSRCALFPRVACFEFDTTSTGRQHRFENVPNLRKHLNLDTSKSNGQTPQRRLYILEGTDLECVEAFGIALQVDPSLLVRHKRIAFWETHHLGGNTPSLPTLIDPQRSFLMEFYELLHFKPDLEQLYLTTSQEKFYLRSAGNERHIGLSRRDGKLENVGIAHRKASFWARKRGIEGWDALMIVDEPTKEYLVGRGKTYVTSTLETEPFQGGYNDFINYKSLEEATATSGPPRSSMFDDLCYYHENHADLLKTDDNPQSATMFLKKVIASHYMLLAEYNRALLDHLEWILSRREDFGSFGIKWVEERWSDLQSSNRRCEDYHRHLQSTIRVLRIERNIHDSSDWMSVSEDFLVLEELFRDLKKKAEGLVSSFTGLAGIVGNRQSLAEARSVRILTILGMTFLPLSFTSGLFSMQGQYLPGASQFWIYIAVAIPLLFIIFALPILIGLGYEPMDAKSRGSRFSIFWKRSPYDTRASIQSPGSSRRQEVA